MSTKVKPPRWVVGSAIIGMALHSATAAAFFEDFSTAPAAANWRIHGESSLFQWNPAGHLEATWDSRRTNSYFYHPLGTILGRDDDFTLVFDLELTFVATGITEGKPHTFELAIGLINLLDATRTNFFRGEGTGAVRNLVELDYFPDSGFGATLWPAFWSTNALLSYRDSDDFTLIELPLNQRLHFELTYTAANRTLKTTILANDQPLGFVHDLVLAPAFTDYRVDAFAICSYSDETTSGSLLATGRLDNVGLVLPPPPVVELSLGLTGGTPELQFVSRTNWSYQAERTRDYVTWTADGELVSGNGERLAIPAEADDDFSFWRIRANRP